MSSALTHRWAKHHYFFVPIRHVHVAVPWASVMPNGVCPHSPESTLPSHLTMPPPMHLVIPVRSQGIISAASSPPSVFFSGAPTPPVHVLTLCGPFLVPPLFRSSSLLTWFAALTSHLDSLIPPSLFQLPTNFLLSISIMWPIIFLKD